MEHRRRALPSALAVLAVVGALAATLAVLVLGPGRGLPASAGLHVVPLVTAGTAPAAPPGAPAIAAVRAPEVPADAAAAALAGPAPVAERPSPAPHPTSTDTPPAAPLTAAVQDTTTDVGVAPPQLRPLPIPGYAHIPPAATSVAPQQAGGQAQLAVSQRPGGPGLRHLSDPTPKGAPLHPLVLDHATDADGRVWTEVSLESRPNGSTGWVRADAVTEGGNPWRIVVLQARHRMLVWYGDSLLADQPVAVGAAGTPTPVGVTYVDVVVDTADPSGPYGRWILGLAAHSEAYDTFGGGDALIALHGTNDADSIGQSVSHGCVRMGRPLAALLARVVPLGTRVDLQS